MVPEDLGAVGSREEHTCRVNLSQRQSRPLHRAWQESTVVTERRLQEAVEHTARRP